MNDTATRFAAAAGRFRQLQAEAFPLAGRRQGRDHYTSNRPERKNPLTLDSYAELRDTFRDLVYADDIKAS